jgi:3-hydroxyacyl-CoA dehydrogenase / 3-hydroxy-2-methylbutyryl-CoA dehydrogenase
VMVNMVGTFHVMAHCIGQMARNDPGPDGERGVVVNVASIAAFEGQVGTTGYSASKAGVVGLSLPAARELATLGIRVNAIAPGLFNTPMAELVDAKAIEALKSAIEFPKRFGDLAEFASLCAYICENAYLNAECIRLDAAARVRAR